MKTLHLTEHCYVLLQGNWIHPHAPLMREQMLWYPERRMTLLDRHQYRPYVKSIVTEDAWLIGLYDREKVRVVYEDGSWQCPNIQTYAASHNNITLCLLGIRATIPAVTCDGGEEIRKFINEYAKTIELANKLYKK